MRVVILPLVLLTTALGCAAQSPDAWRDLEQLKPGDRVEVVLKSNAKHRGEFAMLAADAITLRINKTETGFRRDEVARVSRMGSARRGRAALLGLGIGAGVGAAIGAASCNSATSNCWPFGTSGGVAIGTVFLGALGTGVGAAVARPAKTEVYRAAIVPAGKTEIRAAEKKAETTSPRAASAAPKGSN